MGARAVFSFFATFFKGGCLVIKTIKLKNMKFIKLFSIVALFTIAPFVWAESVASEDEGGGSPKQRFFSKHSKSVDGSSSEKSSKKCEKKGGGHDRKGRKAKMLKKFDANGDGKLDDQERETMKNAMKARHAELLKKFDANGDGRLDESERAAAKESFKKEHSQKKNQD